MVDQVTGNKLLPELLKDQIVIKTDGVPLFIEELTRQCSNRYRRRCRRDYGWPSVDEIAIPDTLHDSLMARLDKLIPVKEVAQIGAAIGREFSYRSIAALSPMNTPELDAALDKLVDSRLVYRRGTPPEASYTFKHA
jgi:predicted ATPase